MVGYMPSSRWTTENQPSAIFGGPLSHHNGLSRFFILVFFIFYFILLIYLSLSYWSLCINIGFHLNVSMGYLSVWTNEPLYLYLFLVSFLGLLSFYLLGFFFLFGCVSIYSVLFCVILIPQKPYFSNERQKEIDLKGREDGKKLRGIQGRDAIIRVYYIRKFMWNYMKKYFQ